jgi:hypothetical protein
LKSDHVEKTAAKTNQRRPRRRNASESRGLLVHRLVFIRSRRRVREVQMMKITQITAWNNFSFDGR